MHVSKPGPHYLLPSSLAQELYAEVRELPVIDHFTHLKLEQLAENKAFHELDSLWLAADPLKKRTIDKSKEGKDAWVDWVGKSSDNFLHPSYAWTHLELQKWWGIDEFLAPENASEIYDEIHRQLNEDTFKPSFFLKESHIKRLHCLLDPVDTIHPRDSFSQLDVDVRPIFSPVQTLSVDDPERFNNYLNRLSEVTGFQLEHYIDLLNALVHSIDRFHQAGCRMAHHRLELMYAESYTQEDVNFIFHKIRLGHELLPIEKARYRSALLHHLSEMYHDRSWVQQYYLGTLRQLKGEESGFDAMGDDETAWYLMRYLNELLNRKKLPKTILSHPYKAGLISSVSSKFNALSREGWIQVRPEWAYMTYHGQLGESIRQLNHPAMLQSFVGMPSSARVFPSLARHDYYKRSLCTFMAREAEKGYFPTAVSGLLPLLEKLICGGDNTFFEE